MDSIAATKKMLSRLVRLILAFLTCPLLGAYGLRWAGSALRGLLEMAGAHGGVLLPLLDAVGSVLGLLLGLIFALQLARCCFQPDPSPVRAVGDAILIVLAVTFVADAVLPRVPGAAPGAAFLPPASLVVWSAAAAATWSLGRLRRELRDRNTALGNSGGAAPWNVGR